MNLQYRFTKAEIDKLLKNAVIIVDTREQRNEHILEFLNKKNIKYEVKKLDHGDYSIRMDASPELHLYRECYIPVVIEKKNSIDELASSFKDRTRFEAEFIRAQGAGTKTYLLIEDANGYENILKNNYRSEYTPAALMASLKAFESRYDLRTAYIDKKLSGDWIYRTLFYELREFLIR